MTPKGSRKQKGTIITRGAVSLWDSVGSDLCMQLLGQLCPHSISIVCGLWSEVEGGLGGPDKFT